MFVDCRFPSERKKKNEETERAAVEQMYTGPESPFLCFLLLQRRWDIVPVREMDTLTAGTTGRKIDRPCTRLSIPLGNNNERVFSLLRLSTPRIGWTVVLIVLEPSRRSFQLYSLVVAFFFLNLHGDSGRVESRLSRLYSVTGDV